MITLKSLLKPILRETPQQKLERITRERRESYEIRRFRERRAASLKRVPTLVLVKSQIVGSR